MIFLRRVIALAPSGAFDPDPMRFLRLGIIRPMGFFGMSLLWDLQVAHGISSANSFKLWNSCSNIKQFPAGIYQWLHGRYAQGSYAVLAPH